MYVLLRLLLGQPPDSQWNRSDLRQLNPSWQSASASKHVLLHLRLKKKKTQKNPNTIIRQFIALQYFSLNLQNEPKH